MALAIAAGSISLLAGAPGGPATTVEASGQQPSAIPEPAGLVLFGAGLLAVARHVRRRKQAALKQPLSLVQSPAGAPPEIASRQSQV